MSIFPVRVLPFLLRLQRLIFEEVLGHRRTKFFIPLFPLDEFDVRIRVISPEHERVLRLRQVNAFVAKLNDSSVDQIAEEMRGKTFLGFIGNEEKFIEKKLRYHVLYQVAFSEVVSAGFLTSWFSDDKEVEDFIYIEPQTLKVLVYKPDAEIQLVDKPAEYASDIKDFDGVADIRSISPMDVSFNTDAWKARQSIEVVQESLKNRFQLEISSIKPIFLPLWCLRYKIQGGHQVRVVHIDALTGKQIII